MVNSLIPMFEKKKEKKEKKKSEKKNNISLNL